jgi:hypothetical protein
MPDLGGSSAHARTDKYRHLKRTILHDIIYDVLAPVRAAQAAGGSIYIEIIINFM